MVATNAAAAAAGALEPVGLFDWSMMDLAPPLSMERHPAFAIERLEGLIITVSDLRFANMTLLENIAFQELVIQQLQSDRNSLEKRNAILERDCEKHMATIQKHCNAHASFAVAMQNMWAQLQQARGEAAVAAAAACSTKRGARPRRMSMP